MMVTGLLASSSIPLEYYDDDTISSTIQSMVREVQINEELQATTAMSKGGNINRKVDSYEQEYSIIRQKKEQALKQLQKAQNITHQSVIKMVQSQKNEILKSAMIETSQILLKRSRVNRTQIDSIFQAALVKHMITAVKKFLTEEI